ncbi:hypothetical protein Poli38472_004341 [Pythium oligandrum]|uniref:Uncharacterized protein n=1 Tax=Pythium oligandrum TaxID=41045 RepID=A0A8K1C9X2_PYTOL|nr:hypothetical protein Poli38472_004341 [Pythium oligandrum]|eukprot:TMW59272.1 hypothetical protein Poli38472_004341 [Pythium oligandrum]
MESIVIRIDHFHDRKLYVSNVRSWLEELGVTTGRLVTMGETHLLFIEATEEQNTRLIECFATRAVDTNVRDEPCIDRFIDVVARKSIEAATCKGFLEINLLNAAMLERMLVHEWKGEKAWLADVLSTPRTKSLLKWRDEAKAARKDRRKRAAQDREVEKAAKRLKAEQDAAAEEQEESEEKTKTEGTIEAESADEKEEADKPPPAKANKPAEQTHKPKPVVAKTAKPKSAPHKKPSPTAHGKQATRSASPTVPQKPSHTSKAKTNGKKR